jgi:hypothetical protein
LQVSDVGGGPALYAGGDFSNAGGVPASGIARWNGASWSTLGTGVDSSVYSLTEFNDGSGSALVAGGPFASAGGVAANHIARWDGSSWSALGSGTNHFVYALAEFDDGGGAALFAGGSFASAPDSQDSYLAKWGCTEAGPGSTYCFGDGSGAVIACPCDNTGSLGHGCANSQFASRGARLASFGSTNPDTVTLTSSEERSEALSIFLQGNASFATGLVYGDGIRCAGGALKRLYKKNASQGTVSAPGPGDLSIRARSAAAGDTIPPGATRYYQVYYRDPVPTFCPSPPGNTWNVSNGIEIVWP